MCSQPRFGAFATHRRMYFYTMVDRCLLLRVVWCLALGIWWPNSEKTHFSGFFHSTYLFIFLTVLLLAFTCKSMSSFTRLATYWCVVELPLPTTVASSVSHKHDLKLYTAHILLMPDTENGRGTWCSDATHDYTLNAGLSSVHSCQTMY